MRSDWLNNSEALRRVTQILRQAGIPLELRAANECQSFCQEKSGPDIPHLRSGKLVYSPHDDHNSYREVDQLVTIHEEFPIGEYTGVQLIGSVPIECKHRHDVEYFAFPIQDNTAHEGFPAWSDLAGSQLFRSLRGTYSTVQRFAPSLVSMVDIRDGKTPSSLFKENLIHNSIASLYDFILTDIGDSPLLGRTFDDKDMRNTDSFTKFQRYIKKNRYAWWSVLRDQVAKIPLNACRQFNKTLYKGRVFYGMHFALPIVCVDGPIYSVSSNQSFEITDYVEIDSCLISIRKQNWPGHARFTLLRRTAEVPAVLTNPKGLRGVLEAAFAWHREIRNALVNADPIQVERWQLETALYSKVLEYYGKKEPLLCYRSDIDIEDVL